MGDGAEIKLAYRLLVEGEPAPWFRQRSTSNPSYAFDTAGGRYIVLCFFATAGDAMGQAALAWMHEHRALFDDDHLSFFGVSLDPKDKLEGRVQQSLPGIRHFWDFDGTVSTLYGVLPMSGTQRRARRLWVVLNPGLQVLAAIPFAADGSDRVALDRLLQELQPVPRYGGMEMHAPVIIVPNVLEADLCRRLMDVYTQQGGTPSGFMRDVAGKTIAVHDDNHKKRSDYIIEDQDLCLLLQKRVQQKVIPVIKKVHCFEVTRMERYLVGCYDSSDGGHFRPHRDNTTRGTAHRRFALSVNLNEDFDGGELVFPEYGPRRYKPPPGCGILFAGALLHAVTPVQRGRRYAFLPFLYDEAAAAQREANNQYLADGVGSYQP